MNLGGLKGVAFVGDFFFYTMIDDFVHIIYFTLLYIGFYFLESVM